MKNLIAGLFCILLVTPIMAWDNTRKSTSTQKRTTSAQRPTERQSSDYQRAKRPASKSNFHRSEPRKEQPARREFQSRTKSVRPQSSSRSSSFPSFTPRTRTSGRSSFTPFRSNRPSAQRTSRPAGSSFYRW